MVSSQLTYFLPLKLANGELFSLTMFPRLFLFFLFFFWNVNKFKDIKEIDKFGWLFGSGQRSQLKHPLSKLSPLDFNMRVQWRQLCGHGGICSLVTCFRCPGYIVLPLRSLVCAVFFIAVLTCFKKKKEKQSCCIYCPWLLLHLTIVLLRETRHWYF